MSSQSNACVQAYYQFDPETDPEAAEVLVEVQKSRLQQDVSEWLADKLLSLFILLCYDACSLFRSYFG